MPQIPAGWKETILGEIANITMGQSPKWETYNDKGDGIPFYQWITEFWEKFVRIKTYSSQPIKIIEPNTILFSVRAPVWKINITKHKACIGRWNAWLFMKNKEQEFLFYLLKYLEKQFLNRSSGTVFDSINRTEIETLPIHLPPLPEQQAIAAVLSSFDDKIELLRAENQTLEQMGQELFKERFGKWKVGDELPEGWRVGKLGEIISLQWWFVHNINLAGWEKTKIAKMWVVDGKMFFNRNSVIWYPDIIPEKYKLEEWDLIICTRDVTQDRLVIWNVALVPDDLAKFWLYAWSNTWIVKTSFHKLFLFLLFRSRNFRNHIIQSAKGSTIVMITQDAFLYTNIIIPDQETLNQFDLVIKPLFNKIRANSEQIQTLSSTRDQLLPKLMSGEVRVEF